MVIVILPAHVPQTNTQTDTTGQSVEQRSVQSIVGIGSQVVHQKDHHKGD